MSNIVSTPDVYVQTYQRKQQLTDAKEDLSNTASLATDLQEYFQH